MDKTSLILVFSDSSCEDCQLHEFSFINNKLHGQLNNIYIIGRYDDFNHFKSYVKSLPYDFNYFYLNNNNSIINNFTYDDVFVFRTNNCMEIYSAHFPTSNIPEISNNYYSAINF